MTVEADTVLTVVGMVATAAAIWGAIRGDMRGMRRDIDRHEDELREQRKILLKRRAQE